MTKREKELVITILMNFLMNKEATYEDFKTIEKIIEKLSKED